MMDYGTNGQVMYDIWKRKFEEITQNVKFGGADPDEAFVPLKTEINDAINEYNSKAERRKKLGLYSIPVAVITLLIGSYSIGTPLEGVMMWLSGFSILVPIYGFMSMSGCKKTVLAAFDFDKLFFDGEIFYRRKNG